MPSTSHPEVASQQQPISAIILDLVARLKEVGARLSKLALRSPASPPFDLLGLNSKLLLQQQRVNSKSSASTAAPSAEALGSVIGHDDDQTNQQQQHQDKNTKSSIQSELDEQESVLSSVVADSVGSGSGDNSAANQDEGDESETPDGEAAEGEGEGDEEESGDSPTNGDVVGYESGNSNNEDADNQDESLPECKTPDCSDLVPDNSHQQFESTLANNENGLGPTNALHNNNNVPYQSPSAPSIYDRANGGRSPSPHNNMITTPGGHLDPTPVILTLNNGDRSQQQQQQQHELYPIYVQNPYPPFGQSTPNSAGLSNMAAQLNGLAAFWLVVHLLLCAVVYAPHRHRLTLRVVK